MKNITFICLLVVFTSRALCQTMPVDKETGRITYTEIVKCDSANAKKLYKAAKLWMLNAYNTDKYVRQLDDDESKTIVILPVIAPLWHESETAGYVYYSLTLECRDGRYKYTFTNFKHLKKPETTMCDGGNLENETYVCPSLIMNKKDLWADIRNQTNDNIIALIADMKKSIATTINLKKADW